MSSPPGSPVVGSGIGTPLTRRPGSRQSSPPAAQVPAGPSRLTRPGSPIECKRPSPATTESPLAHQQSLVRPRSRRSFHEGSRPQRARPHECNTDQAVARNRRRQSRATQSDRRIGSPTRCAGPSRSMPSSSRRARRAASRGCRQPPSRGEPGEGRVVILEMFSPEFALGGSPRSSIKPQTLPFSNGAVPLGLRGCGSFTVRDRLIAFQRGHGQAFVPRTAPPAFPPD
jgi:hypothetical protein